MRLKSFSLFITAGILLLIGFILPLLMVSGIIANLLVLSFIAYISSTVGLITGVMASVFYVIEKRKN